MDNNQKQKFKETALKELEKGKSPEEIIQQAQKAGASKEEINIALQELFNEQPGSEFITMLGKFFGKNPISIPNYPENKKEGEEYFWDPAGERIFNTRFEQSNSQIEKKYQELQKNPTSLRWKLFLSLIPIFILLLIIIFFTETLFRFISSLEDASIILVVPFLPVIWYVRKIHILQKDLTKLMIAKSKNWCYSPDENIYRWQKFRDKFREIFDKGNENQNMQDEFWGIFKNIPFYSGIFQYTVKTHSNKRTHRTTYTNTVFAIKLNKVLKSDFRLEPEGMMAKIGNFFSSKEIEMESAEFNDKFAFYYNGQRGDKELEIVKTLSPSVQVRILTMLKNQGEFTLQFREDIALFIFKGKLLKKMHTNFLKKVEINPRDIEAIENRLNNMLNIATEIVPFLD